LVGDGDRSSCEYFAPAELILLIGAAKLNGGLARYFKVTPSIGADLIKD
jgi:hypothetical protein